MTHEERVAKETTRAGFRSHSPESMGHMPEWWLGSPEWSTIRPNVQQFGLSSESRVMQSSFIAIFDQIKGLFGQMLCSSHSWAPSKHLAAFELCEGLRDDLERLLHACLIFDYSV